MAKLRILLGDDHDLILEGIKSVLAKDFEIVGVSFNGKELVAKADLLKPDAVLLDISMPVLNGIEAARQIKKSAPETKLVFVTQRTDREYVQIALQLGANGYLLKQSVAGELLVALHEVFAGRYYITPTLRDGNSNLFLNPYRNPSDLFATALTPRQREVLQLLAEGKSNKEIAGILNVSVKTVDFHKAGIIGELGIRTTAELTRYAIEHGIVEP